MGLTWEQSGSRNCDVTLQDAQQLAVESGFLYDNDSGDMPLARRANLQGALAAGREFSFICLEMFCWALLAFELLRAKVGP
jgi:hypothetical protein